MMSRGGILAVVRPVSRGRKAKKRNKPAKRIAPVSPVAGTEPCDCPVCADPPVELSQLVDGILVGVRDDAPPEDLITVERGAALTVAMCEMAGEEYEDALVAGFVPEFESRAETGALVMLLGLGSVCGDRVERRRRTRSAGWPEPASNRRAGRSS